MLSKGDTLPRIQTDRRLVEDEHLGIVHQGRCQEDALALTTREGTEPGAEQFVSANGGQGLLAPRGDLGPGDAVHGCAELDEFPHPPGLCPPALLGHVSQCGAVTGPLRPPVEGIAVTHDNA